MVVVCQLWPHQLDLLVWSLLQLVQSQLEQPGLLVLLKWLVQLLLRRRGLLWLKTFRPTISMSLRSLTSSTSLMSLTSFSLSPILTLFQNESPPKLNALTFESFSFSGVGSGWITVHPLNNKLRFRTLTRSVLLLLYVMCVEFRFYHVHSNPSRNRLL